MDLKVPISQSQQPVLQQLTASVWPHARFFPVTPTLRFVVEQKWQQPQWVSADLRRLEHCQPAMMLLKRPVDHGMWIGMDSFWVTEPGYWFLRNMNMRRPGAQRFMPNL